MAQFLKGDAKGDSFLAIEEEARELSLSSRCNNLPDDFREDIDRAIEGRWVFHWVNGGVGQVEVSRSPAFGYGDQEI